MINYVTLCYKYGDLQLILDYLYNNEVSIEEKIEGFLLLCTNQDNRKAVKELYPTLIPYLKTKDAFFCCAYNNKIESGKFLWSKLSLEERMSISIPAIVFNLRKKRGKKRRWTGYWLLNLKI
jgi:hypothetical protein